MKTIEIYLERLRNSGLAGFELGEPISENQTLPDDIGEYIQFENGNLYYRPDLGAFEVHGEVLEKFVELGETESGLGYPVSDQMVWFDECVINYFENGAIAQFSPDDDLQVIFSLNSSFSQNNTAYLYEIDGTFISTLNTFPDQTVVVLDRDSQSFNQLIHKDKPLPHDVFIELAAWAYNENTLDSDSQHATICVLNNMTKASDVWYGFDKKTYDKQIDIALIDTIYKQSGYSDKTKLPNRNVFVNRSLSDRNNNEHIKSAISGVIRTLYLIDDISNGAIQEHGNDFFSNEKTPNGGYKWPMRNEWQKNGFTWLEGGFFFGKYMPHTNPEQIGDDAKTNKYDFKYIITASYGDNIFCVFNDAFKKKNPNR